jgi:GT2 family glycosyltransferase
MTPDISTVIVSFNTAEHLPQTLDALPAACVPRAFETIVVDNASRDGTVEMLSTRDDIVFLPLDRNTGFTAAANLGASRAAGKHLLFANPDMVPPPGSIAQLADVLEANPGAWGVTPRFRFPDGSPQYFWRRMMGAPGMVLCHTRWGKRLDRAFGGRARKRREYSDLPDAPGTVPIDTAGAACLLVQRREFLDAGGFDDRYFNLFQDTDLARRMLRARRVLLGVGDVEVLHQMGVTFRDRPHWVFDAEFERALLQFLRDEPWYRRLPVAAAIRLDVALPPHRRDRRALIYGDDAPRE